MDNINFIPPQNSNNAVMVNDSNELVNPDVNSFLNANPQIAKASDVKDYNETIKSLTTKTQNMSAQVGKTTFSGSISSGNITSNNIDVSGDLNVSGTLKASNIGNLIGKSLSVENLTVTDTLTARNFEVDIPDTILNVEGVKSKGIIEANNFQETNPNKFVKGWFLARVEDSENDGNKNIYISNKQYSYAEITGAELPSDFETADFSNISVNDVFYFYNSRHFPYAFRVISIYENYLEVKEINDNSLTINSSNLSSFRYGLFIIGIWDNSNNSVVFSTTKIDVGYANFYNNVLAIGDDNSLGYNSCSTGTSCSSIGMYSNCFGNGNVAISYSSTAFGQNNFVLGEKCSAIGANNNIEGGNGNVAFGYNNKIYSSNVGTTISESSVALGEGIKIDTTINPKISFGKYNIDEDNIIFSVGNGTSDNNRSNAFEVYRDGSFSSPILENLQLFKANTGALHFNGSGYAQCSKLLRNQKFSFAVRIKANKNDVLTGKQVNIIDTGVFYLYINSSVQRLSVYATGNSLKSVTVEQNDRIFDGNWHSLFVTYDGTTLTLLDEFGVLLTADYSIQEQTSNTKIGANFVGEMSDVCLFNFDTSSTDALYTIADYQQGKPIPPKAFEYINQNVAELPIESTLSTSLSASPSNKILHFDRGADVSVNGDAITWTSNSTITTGFPKAIVYKFAKALIGSGFLKVDIGNISKVGSFELVRFGMIDSSGTWSYPSLSSFGFDKGEQSFNVPYTNGCLAITIGIASAWENGDSFTIDYLKVEHNGTILALEDYTINGKILDYSGNKNHATITGYVMGDNDTRIEAFVEEITTSTSEQN